MPVFIEKLKHRLGLPLPGNDAHLRMSPALRGTTEEALKGLTSPARNSAVMLLLYPDGAGWRIVLTKRHDYKGVHSGQISFPGGKQEETDPDLQFTALRETFEEVGVPSSEINILGSLSRIYIPPSNFLVYPFVGYCETAPVFNIDPVEVEKLILPEVNFFMNESIVKQGKFKASGNLTWEIEAPYFELDTYRIWGATAAILSEFKELLREVIS